MTTYANAKPAPANSVADARLYWRISAPVLTLVALLGFLLNATKNGALLGAGFLAFDYAHNAVHLLIALAGFYLGFAATYPLAKNAAKLFGIVYLGLAVVGFMSADVFGVGKFLGLHLEVGENLVHLVLGSWAAYAGFAE